MFLFTLISPTAQTLDECHLSCKLLSGWMQLLSERVWVLDFERKIGLKKCEKFGTKDKMIFQSVVL